MPQGFLENSVDQRKVGQVVDGRAAALKPRVYLIVDVVLDIRMLSEEIPRPRQGCADVFVPSGQYCKHFIHQLLSRHALAGLFVARVEKHGEQIIGLIGAFEARRDQTHDHFIQHFFCLNKFAVGLCWQPVGDELEGIQAITDMRESGAVRFADGVGIAGYIGAEKGRAGNAHSDFHHAVGNVDRPARVRLLLADERLGGFNHEGS